jgi:hypothetical protein
MFLHECSYYVSTKHDNCNLLRYRKPEDNLLRSKHVVLKNIYYSCYNYLLTYRIIIIIIKY